MYTLEYATQDDFKGGSDYIEADCRFLELGCRWDDLTVKAGYEVLGSNGVYSFSTPFATLHAFNGWADKFLSTPSNGLIDKYIMASFQIELGERPLAIRAVYHDFKSDIKSVDYGEELDLLAQIKLCEGSSLMVKYAGYNANEYATDTKKIWVAIQYSF